MQSVKKKSMSFKALVGILCLGLSSLATAIPIDYSFVFENALNGGGEITGVVRGLEEGISSATSVEILTSTSGLGIGEYIGSPLTNSWTVSGGIITDFDFLSAGVLNTAPDVTTALLFMDSTLLSGAAFRAGVAPSPGPFVTGSGFVSTADIGLTFTAIPNAPLSESSIGILLMLGLGLIGVSRKRMSR